MSGLLLRYLAYFGPDRPAAGLEFERGLNVICGASETGKSFIVETIDFMLGQQEPVRDIPERDGYPHACRSMWGCTGNSMRATTPARAIIFRAFESVIGPPRSVTNT